MAAQTNPGLDVQHLGQGEFRVALSGNWCLPDFPRFEVQSILDHDGLRRLSFDVSALRKWDSTLVGFLLNVVSFAKAREIHVDEKALPDGVQRLLKLATAVGEKDTRRGADSGPLLHNVGTATVGMAQSLLAMTTFIGDTLLACFRMTVGRASLRWSDLVLIVQECGVLALPIVSLISFLVGLILAFVGAIQLQKFGAEIYVADLVAIAMAREMAPIMTGIIMAGRTGAAFAAQLGTMTVNEEIDALRTLGISPIEFLVLPRMVALGLMMPLLCVYADLVGIIGGIVVGVGMLDLSLTQYMNQTQESMGLTHISIGLIKGFVFGLVVAFAGCLRGLQCGRSAASVGVATTSAVVTAIVMIIAIDAMFAFVTNVLGV